MATLDGSAGIASISLRRTEGTKRYEDIANKLMEGIEAGAYAPGAALPPERTLARTFGVGRGTIREAVRVLEHGGLLDVRTGSGIFVTDEPASAVLALRARAALLGEHSPIDIIVARRAVEPVCARHAALRRSQHQLRSIERILDEHAALVAAHEDPEEPDLAFHVQIAEASRNSVLLAVVQQLVDAMQERTWRELKHRSRDRPGGQERFLDHHRRIFAALQRQDEARAARAMDTHLRVIETMLLAEL